MALEQSFEEIPIELILYGDPMGISSGWRMT
jgi:hypothetical protein